MRVVTSLDTQSQLHPQSEIWPLSAARVAQLQFGAMSALCAHFGVVRRTTNQQNTKAVALFEAFEAALYDSLG